MQINLDFSDQGLKVIECLGCDCVSEMKGLK